MIGMHSQTPGTQRQGSIKRAVRFGASIAAISTVLVSCSGPQSMFGGAGTGARETESVWWLMFILGTIIFVGVLALLWWGITRANSDNDKRASSDSRVRMVVLGGVLLPVVVIGVVFAFSTRGLMAIGDLRSETDVTIDVVGHQYWWEVTYPNDDVVTANEIHIPVDQDVEIRLTSADVIHSFWIPSLHGKIDMMPGHSTSINIRAEKAGEYRGQCAQFCGAQHANMAFIVVVHEEDAYQAWISQQQQPAVTVPDDESIVRGQEIFFSSMCVYCHAINGTSASATIGPDLTHLNSRQTLGAGMMENTRGNLAAWIVDPQSIKPGNIMPGITLSGEDLDALLDYLESLD